MAKRYAQASEVNRVFSFTWNAGKRCFIFKYPGDVDRRIDGPEAVKLLTMIEAALKESVKEDLFAGKTISSHEGRPWTILLPK